MKTRNRYGLGIFLVCWSLALFDWEQAGYTAFTSLLLVAAAFGFLLFVVE